MKLATKVALTTSPARADVPNSLRILKPYIPIPEDVGFMA